MKVTDIKTFTVDCFRTNWVFVKVYTDEGITGVGEATLEYKQFSCTGHFKIVYVFERRGCKLFDKSISEMYGTYTA